MGTMNDALNELSKREGMTSIPDLAKATGSTEDTLRKQLSTLKGKGYVDGNSKEGWIITPDGRAALERGDKIPLTRQDVGSDPESKLKYYGQLAGVLPDVILATVELIIAGDSEDLEHVWNCMTEMDVPIAERRRWFALYRNYLKQGIPPSIKERVTGPLEEERGTGDERASASAKKGGRDYIIVDDLPVFVGPDQGDYPLQDAKDIIQSRALRSRFAGSGGGGGGGGSQGWGPEGIAKLLQELRTPGGEGTTAKIYALEQGEQGIIMKELKPGEPLTLNPPGGNKPSPILIVDSEGVLQEAKPGTRVVAAPGRGNSPPQKITLVRQTKDGIVKEEHNAGDVIILGGESQGGGTGMGIPFPVFDEKGAPVVDKDGRPVYANLESTLKVLGWRDEQRRANERHDAVIGLVQTAREKLGDGIEALREAAAEVKAGTSQKSGGPQIYRCGTQGCGAEFTLPATEDWKIAVCPKCQTQYPREQVMSV